MVSATVFLQLTSNYGKLICVPANKTLLSNYGVAEAKFVEYSCLSETNGALRYMYWISFVGTPLAFAFSNLWSYIPGYGKCINGFVQTCKLHEPIASFISERLEYEGIFLKKEWVKIKDKKEVLNALENIRTLYWALAKDRKRTFNVPQSDNGNQSRPELSSSNQALITIRNKKNEVKLIPGTSKFFCKFYFFNNLCMLLISSEIYSYFCSCCEDRKFTRRNQL